MINFCLELELFKYHPSYLSISEEATPHPKRLFSKISSDIAQVILNVRTYFQKEKNREKVPGKNHVVQKTVQAIGVSKKIVNKLRSGSDLRNFPDTRKVKRTRKSRIEAIFGPIVICLIRDLFISEQNIPTLKLIHEKILSEYFKVFGFWTMSQNSFGARSHSGN